MAYEKFDSRVEFEPNTGCHLWSGAANWDGYGITTMGGRTQIASRVSFSRHHGEIPAGMIVCHKCDTPACVNPAHLFVGTKRDNNRDRSAKGRNHNNTGQRHGRAKISDADALEILAACRAGEAQSGLAARFNIHQSTVSDIKTGRRWSKITREISA